MELTVLGSSGTWPNADTATSGYLVQHDGFNLWMDAGTGTLANLQQHIDIPDLDAIVISHEHPDHFVDLYPAFYAWHYGELGEPGLPVFVPTDFSQRLADLVSIDSQVAMRTLVRLHRGRARARRSRSGPSGSRPSRWRTWGSRRSASGSRATASCSRTRATRARPTT